MISSLRGPVLEIRLDSLVIGVGGVGMTVMCSPDTISQARTDQEITLFTSLIVREDSLTLFGFANSENREMFEVVQGVSGFGPKLAFTILSSLPADELRTAIGNEDVARLKQTPGVGAKGAQRLVLELKDRIEHQVLEPSATQVRKRNGRSKLNKDYLALVGHHETRNEQSLR